MENCFCLIAKEKQKNIIINVQRTWNLQHKGTRIDLHYWDFESKVEKPHFSAIFKMIGKGLQASFCKKRIYNNDSFTPEDIWKQKQSIL